jgi:uncharacterized protein (DUF433 family)
MKKLDRITINQRVCLGQPTIRGMRITVNVVLKLLAEDKTEQEITQIYPELTHEDIHQCMQYAAWTTSERFDLNMVATV